MIGWQLIGFPGPRMSYVAELEKYRGEAYRPKPMSLAQVTQHPNPPRRRRAATVAFGKQAGGKIGRLERNSHVKTLPKTDVVVIGGGWTGLLIAKELAARTPLSVTVLERGSSRHKEDYAGGIDQL